MQNDKTNERKDNFFDWPCGHCFKLPAPEQNPLKCANCRMVAYCDKQCQRHHWKEEHKQECKLLAAAKKSKNVDSVLPPANDKIGKLKQKMKVLTSRFHRQLNRGNLEKAEREARNIIRSWSDHKIRVFQAHADLAQVLYHRREYDAALQESRIAVGLDWDSSLYPIDKDIAGAKIQGFFFIGDIHRMKGNLDRAFLSYQQALNFCTEHKDADMVCQGLETLGQFWQGNHDDKALACFELVVKFKPNSPALLKRMAESSLRKAIKPTLEFSFYPKTADLETLNQYESSLRDHVVPDAEKALEYSETFVSLNPTAQAKKVHKTSLLHLINLLRMLIKTQMAKAKLMDWEEKQVLETVVPNMYKFQEYGEKLLKVHPEYEQVRSEITQYQVIFQALEGNGEN